MQLIGEYQHNLDTKGRVNFPAKLREALGAEFMLCKGLGDSCLFVYSMEEWEKLSQKINSQPMAKAKKLQRFLFSGATMAEPDKQGRILIPQNLRAYANLEKDVVIVGAANRAEIWDLETWNENSQLLTAQMIEQELEGMDF